MKTKCLIFMISSLMLFGCKKEDATFNKFIVSNNSGVIIKISPTSILNDTLILLNDQTKEFDLSFTRGISTGINYASFVDGKPIMVIFNASDTIVHYNDTLIHNGKYYKQTFDRNLYNTSSYEKEIIDDTKHLRTVRLKYIFSNQDYLDAK